MLSYKQWQKLNESVGTHTLGLGRPSTLGTVGSRWDEGGMDMMPSRKSKKMFGGGSPGGEEEAPDGRGVMPPMKKKGGLGKPMPPMGDEGEEDDLGGIGAGDEVPDDDDGDDDDDDGMPDDVGGDDDGDDDGMPDDVGGDEGMPDMGGDDGDGDVAGDVPAPPMGKGKKGGLLDKTKAVRDGAHMMHKGASKMIKGMKESHVAECACDKCKKSAKKMPRMTKEEAEFFQSIHNQTGSTRFAVDNETGDWVAVQEDAVLPPSDPNKMIARNDEPGPGEVGYAPSGRVGNNPLGTFTEWASKYGAPKKKTKAAKGKVAAPKKQPKQGKSWFQ